MTVREQVGEMMFDRLLEVYTTARLEAGPIAAEIALGDAPPNGVELVAALREIDLSAPARRGEKLRERVEDMECGG